MAERKQKFSASAAITITLNSLASAAARQATAIDNTGSLYLDALVTVIVTLAAGTPAADKAVYVYAAGSEDGTNYTDNATGTDGAITLRAPTALRIIGVIPVPDSGGLVYKSHPFSVAAAFGGMLPSKWAIVVDNKSGLALASSGCSASYTGVTEVIA